MNQMLATRPAPLSSESRSVTLPFEDNRLLQQLFGAHDEHMAKLERLTGVRVDRVKRGLCISGPMDGTTQAEAALRSLWRGLERGEGCTMPQVDAALRMAEAERDHEPRLPLRDLPQIRTRKGVVAPRSPAQAQYMDLLGKNDITFGIGPAGTGKTYLAVAQGVAMLLAGRVERIVLSRPAVEAGERLGFLPGDMKEKVDPYLRPLYDALHDMVPPDQLAKRMAQGEIEIAPLAFMRGRTLAHCYAILDEAQNTSPAQMKMFLTRLGEGSRMVVTGDPTQIDLPPGAPSGLVEACAILGDVPGIGMMRFAEDDVVRHPLVGRIVKAYAAAGEPARSPGGRAARA
ncbi:MAG: PhoH family protein [Alphaproteobacteria bacterium]|nr:PhoH family protein [Alphaproteobacteria bacterium]